MRSLLLGTVTAVALALGAAALSATPAVAHRDSPAAAPAKPHVPGLAVRQLVTGLDHPWDVRPIGGGRLIYTQRDRAIVAIWDHGKKRTVANFPTSSVWVSGETGLMGLEVDPGFRTNHRFYTCQGGFTDGGHDVRVMSWTLNDALTSITSARHLVGGFPTSTGRHGGCRLLAPGDGSLYVGTGDAAQGANPEDRTSLGGKTLRLDARTGRPWPANPFIKSDNRRTRYVQTFGHRNVQGLALRKDHSGGVYSVEQGTYRDDEVNLIRNGGDYGYNPVPGYNESVPMTDQSLPGRQWPAVWRSGDPTIATSGGGFIYGKGWGAYHGNLVLGALAGERAVFLQLTKGGAVRAVRVPTALRKYGRIRTVVDGPGSVIYLTTDNGGGHDAILAVRPKG